MTGDQGKLNDSVCTNARGVLTDALEHVDGEQDHQDTYDINVVKLVVQSEFAENQGLKAFNTQFNYDKGTGNFCVCRL